jgi:hypothetical protein
MADEDGLTVMLSPVHLAAVLQGEAITPPETLNNRLWGGLKVLGGALELAGSAALLAAPEPTMLTKAGGIVLAVHGSDTAAAGLRQIWTGQPEKTLTEMGATALAKELGADDQTAENIGVAVDIAVPVAAAMVVGAARVMSVRAGRIVLAEEEAAGGHTIARHVGRTEGQLQARLASEPRIPAASSFRTIEEAQAVLSRAMRANRQVIETWAKNPNAPNRLRLLFNAGQDIGYGVVRQTGGLQNMQKVRIVLEKTSVNGKLYYILTSFPEP